MPKTRHYAKAPNGQVFHRTSQSRVYSHVVLGLRSKETALRFANSQSAKDQDARNWDYANSKVTGQRDWYNWESEENRQRDRSRVAEGRDNYINRKCAERIVAINAVDFAKWHDLGWASRLDLAQKNASSHAAKDHWAEVIIVEAVIA
jgi:hypothetical protein